MMKNSDTETRFNVNCISCNPKTHYRMKRIHVSLLFTIAALFFAFSVTGQYIDPVRIMDIPVIAYTYHDTILIDGTGNDYVYSPTQTMKIAKRAGAANPNGLEDGDTVDFDAWFKAAWDRDYLYLYVEVTDDIEESMPVSGIEAWTWDNIEVYIDLDTCSFKNEYDSTSTVQLRINRGEAGITSPGRASVDEYQYVQINNDDGWMVEIGIPWKCAFAEGAVPDILVHRDEGFIGFDLSVADADGPGGGLIGGRNNEGGAQMFWDQDTPIEHADNAYQNRRAFGWANLVAYPCCENLSYIPSEYYFMIYPNPAGDYLIIEAFNSSAVHDCMVKITNLLGETILETEIAMPEYKIDLSSITQKGMHIIRLFDTMHNLLEVKKVILQ
jgi:hypothetical protein